MIILFMSGRSLASVFNVPGDYTTITAALKVADDGDTIRVAAGGTYSTDTGESFPIRLQKAIVLESDPNNMSNLIGDNEHTVILIETGRVTLRGFRIMGGNGSEGINSMDGGGICVFVGPSETDPVTIQDCQIEFNTCPSDETYDGSGGGIYCGGTYCTCFEINIINCIIRQNFVHGQGGGVCCALLSNVKMNDTLIKENSADDHGGGVFVDVYASVSMANTRLDLNNCPGDPLKPNWGGKGGGLACESYGLFTATDCVFSLNTAKYFGGGIFTRGGLFAGENLCGDHAQFPHISDSLIEKNNAELSGGGVYVAGSGVLECSNTTYYWNDAKQDGGAVFVAGGASVGGEVYFADGCLLEGNECAQHGGGVYLGPRALGTFDSTRFLGNSALFDGGALFLETGTAVELFWEDFEHLPLGQSVEEQPNQRAKVWTKTAPEGWTIDDSGVPGVGNTANDGMTEWAGWSFTNKDWWIDVAGNQRRSEFTLGMGTVAVVDADEWDDAPHAQGTLTSMLNTPAIDISGVNASTIELKFDSSWRPNAQQTAYVLVSFDGREWVRVLNWQSDSTRRNFKPEATSETVTISIDNPTMAQNMVLAFGLLNAGNDWWWAIDNVQVSGISGGAVGKLTNCLVTYNNSARGYGGGIYAKPATSVELVHCSVVGNFAPNKRSGIYLNTGAIVDINDSILWRNAGGSVENNGAILNITTSLNEDGADLNQGVLCCNPEYVGWGSLEGIYVDKSTLKPGVGMPENPYRDLQVALDGFDFRLAADSPCLGTSSDGGNLGADTGVGGIVGNIIATLYLMDGNYDIRGRNIIFIHGLQGNGSAVSSIRHAVLGYVEDAFVTDLTIKDEEIFGGIAIRADVHFENSNVSENTVLADGGGIYVAEGNCVMKNCFVSANTCHRGNGGGIYLSPEVNLDLISTCVEYNSAVNGGGGFASSGTNISVTEGSSFNENASSVDGAGLYLDINSVSSFKYTEIFTNIAHNNGGGIFLAGQLSAANVNFTSNIVDAGSNRGGGVYITGDGDFTVYDCNFVTNSAGRDGGGINSFGKLEIHNSVFESNVSTYGGAIHIVQEPAGPGYCADSLFYKNKANQQGGAIRIVDYTAPVFTGCEFIENTARYGGVGMCRRASRAIFDNCVCKDNSTFVGHGGSFYLWSSGTQFHRCTFNGSSAKLDGAVAFFFGADASLLEDCNSVDSHAGRNGGVFYITDSAKPVFSNVRALNGQAENWGGGISIFKTAWPVFTDVSISNCQAVYGGGVYARESSKSTFQQCKFMNNRAYELTMPGDGGGGYFTENASAWFTQCEFRDNEAQDDGGGLGIAELAKVYLWNTLFVGNKAIDDGGGIHFTSQAAGILRNCTLTLNSAVHGGTGAGIYLEANNVVSVDSSIIWNNSPDGIRSEGNPSVSYSCVQRVWPGIGNIVSDPLFDPVTFGLQDGSPCIDAGNPDPSMNDACLPPGKGEPRNDMGITGGPQNCDWSSSLDPQLMGWWMFDETSDATAIDSSGRGQHANLVNGPIPVRGLLGEALDFDSVDDYVELPIGGLISTLTDSTFAIWADFKNTGGNWQRIFDFGTGTAVNMFLTPRMGSAGAMRFVIKPSGGAGESQATAPSTLATGWHHVAVVFKSGTITLYLDSVSLAVIQSTLTPSSLGVTTNNWLGRSQYGNDGYLSAKLDDFRIYKKALSPQELARIMQGENLQ